jgi:NADH pyrophosphatase NudC (nudix superfamily)
MCGFEARWVSGEATPQADEMDAVTWFTRDQIAAAASSEAGERWDAPIDERSPDVILPPRMAIARWLIDGWLQRTA